MADVIDTVRFYAEANEVAEDVSRGEPGLLALRRVIDLAMCVTGAHALAVVEFGPATGRIVIAGGTAEVIVGRRVDTADPRLIALIGGERSAVVAPTALPTDLRPAVPGVAKALVGRVTRGDVAIGLVIAYLPEGVEPGDAQRADAFRYLTAVVSRIYRESPNLPLHPGPVTRQRADTAVVVGAGGRVQWLNSVSAHLLAPLGVKVGDPFPLPVPGPGQVVEHDVDGRCLALSARRWPDTPDVAVTVRDITEARRWEQSRELFVGLTSHELRTPVTVIKGYADTLNDRWDGLDDASRREAVRVLGQRADELARLLDRLLSAVGEPGVPPLVSRFDLRDAVTSAVAELPRELRGRVRESMPDGLPPVFGERASIASIVSELVANAGKYAPPAAGDIEIDGVFDAATVSIRVSDRGIGVRPEHVESAFERFWQADTGDHRRYGGVGLGLYLVRRIVERQNGWVSLRPRDSGGTVAEVRLPRGDLGRASQRQGEA